MSTFKGVALIVAMAVTIATAPTMAQESSDFIARAGCARVGPDVDSEEFSNVPCASGLARNSDTLCTP